MNKTKKLRYLGIICIFIVLLVLNSSVIFADAITSHPTLYVNTIKPISGNYVNFQANLNVLNGLIRGILTPGGYNDSKTVLGLDGNVLFNSQIRPEFSIVLEGCDGSVSANELGFLFDGKLNFAQGINGCTPTPGQPIVITINMPNTFLHNDLVLGWVSDFVRPKDFKFKLHVYGIVCDPINGFCNNTCIPGRAGCNYDPDEVELLTPDEIVANGNDLDWIEFYNSNDELNSENFAFSKYFDVNTTQNLISLVDPTYYGSNLVVSGLEFTIDSLNIIGESGIFPLSELFFINTVNSPYEGLYAMVEGDTFYGNVSTKGSLISRNIIGSNNLNVTNDVNTTFLTSHENFVYASDLTAGDSICHNFGNEFYCVGEGLWQIETNDDISYFGGKVVIGDVPTSMDSSLLVIDCLGIYNKSTEKNITLIATEGGDFRIEPSSNRDVVFKLNFAIPEFEQQCGDGVIQHPNDAGINEECEFVNSQVYFPLGPSCSDYGYSNNCVPSCGDDCLISGCYIPNLVAYFPFSQGAPLEDATGNGYTLSSYGPSWTSNGRTGGAYNFDGTNDYFRFTRMISDNFTISFWINTVNPDQSSSYSCNSWWDHTGLVSISGYGDDRFTTFLCFNYFAAGISSPYSSVASTDSVVDGDWHHVVATRNKQTGLISIYVDGYLEGTKIASTNSLVGSSYMFIGKKYLHYYQGLMDEVRIYNRDLTADEVQTIYDFY